MTTRWTHVLAILLACVMFLTLEANTQAQQVEPLPLVMSPKGVLFRIRAPGAKAVYLAGTFNGWAASDGCTVSDPASKMYGPDENGIFEIFYSLTPGSHIFKFCVDGTTWYAGDPSLPRKKDDFDTTSCQNGMAGSSFEFALGEPPWPSYVPTTEMIPVIVVHKGTNQPYLRVRFFSRQAQSAHIVGNWDGWAGIAYRAVQDPAKAMYKTRVPNVWEKYIGPLKEGTLEYKIVANNRMWLSDPSVREQSQDGNTLIQIVQMNGQWVPQYRPRFDPKAVRQDTGKRWGGNLVWEDDRNAGFAKANLTKQRMIWVITLPKSRISEQLMKDINADAQLTGTLANFVCLETSANEVEDIMRQRKINRLPYVILVDSKYKPVYEKFNPSIEELRQKTATLP